MTPEKDECSAVNVLVVKLLDKVGLLALVNRAQPFGNLLNCPRRRHPCFPVSDCTRRSPSHRPARARHPSRLPWPPPERRPGSFSAPPQAEQQEPKVSMPHAHSPLISFSRIRMPRSLSPPCHTRSAPSAPRWRRSAAVSRRSVSRSLSSQATAILFRTTSTRARSASLGPAIRKGKTRRGAEPSEARGSAGR